MNAILAILINIYTKIPYKTLPCGSVKCSVANSIPTNWLTSTNFLFFLEDLLEKLSCLWLKKLNDSVPFKFIATDNLVDCQFSSISDVINNIQNSITLGTAPMSKNILSKLDKYNTVYCYKVVKILLFEFII